VPPWLKPRHGPPHTVSCEDALAAVVIDEPDLAALIDFHAGVAIHGLAVEESATVVGDDPDCLVDLLGALALQGEFVFFVRSLKGLR
jgi:hypothetical protein